MSSRPYVPTCPFDGRPLVQWSDGIGCPHCLREWVVSVSEAYPHARMDVDAPFASLVLEIDGAKCKRRTAHPPPMSASGSAA